MSHHHHPHAVSEQEARSERYRETLRVTLIGSVVDLLLGVAKIFVGMLAQSQALIADGIHSLSDLVTDVFVIYAAKHAHQEADEEHPYGHGRIETVATVGLGVVLIGVGIGISIDAVNRLFHPEDLSIPGMWAMVVAIISIFSKEAIYRYSMIIARKYRSKMLEANAWHSRTDAITSIVVVIGVGGSMLGLTYLDELAAVGVAYFIARIGWDLAWQSLRELIDTGLESERVDEIRDCILNVDGVESLHILRSRQMGGNALVDVHVQVEPRISISEGHYISETVRKQVIRQFDEVTDVMVHIDPEDDEVAPLNPRLSLRKTLEEQLHRAWQDIDEASQIKNLVIHYLEGCIQLEVVLPLALLKNSPEQEKARLQAQFDQVSQSIPDVHSVNLLFS